jgi:hypothetical protein
MIKIMYNTHESEIKYLCVETLHLTIKILRMLEFNFPGLTWSFVTIKGTSND